MKKAYCDCCMVEIDTNHPSAFQQFTGTINGQVYTFSASRNDATLDLCGYCLGNLLICKDQRPAKASSNGA